MPNASTAAAACMLVMEFAATVQLLPQPGISFEPGITSGCCALSLGNKILTSYKVDDKGGKPNFSQVALLDITAGARSLIDRIPKSCQTEPYGVKGRISDNLMHISEQTWLWLVLVTALQGMHKRARLSTQCFFWANDISSSWRL